MLTHMLLKNLVKKSLEWFLKRKNEVKKIMFKLIFDF